MLDLEKQIHKQLEKSKNILIVFPDNQNSDALASALALYLFLKGLKINVDIAGSKNNRREQAVSFLPSYNDIQTDLTNIRRFIVSLNISQAEISQIKYSIDNSQLNFIISPKKGWFKPEDVSAKTGEFKYDLIFAIGLTDLESIGKIYDDNIEFFYKTTIINIDYQAANEEFGQINYLDLSAISASEAVLDILKHYKPEMLSADIATCLLTGIITQTKNFKTANLTPRLLSATSELLTAGAKREEIINRLYQTRDVSSLKLWGKLLNNLKTENKNQLLWSKLSKSDFKGSNIDADSLNDIIEELIATVPDARIAAIFCEETPDKTTLIIYSLKTINAQEIIKEYAPTGTIKIAQAVLNMGINKTIDQTIPKLRSELEKLSL